MNKAMVAKELVRVAKSLVAKPSGGCVVKVNFTKSYADVAVSFEIDGPITNMKNLENVTEVVKKELKDCEKIFSSSGIKTFGLLIDEGGIEYVSVSIKNNALFIGSSFTINFTENQKKVIKELCKKNKWVVYDIYS